MSVGGSNEASRGSETTGPSQTESTDSGLANAGADRVEAAREALDTGTIGQAQGTAAEQLAQAAPVEIETPAAQPQLELAQLTNVAPPPPSTLELAQMAQAVYGTTAPPEGWSVAAADQLAEIGLTPDMLTSPTSQFQAQVYVREINGQTSYTISFRGTQSRNDWVANGQQGLGLETDHYNRALEIGESVVVPDGARVTMTGHSLGGGLASTAAIAAELDATTFNAAGLHDNTIDAAQTIAAADGQLDVPDIRAVYVRGDILSLMQDGGDQMIGGFIGRGLGSWLGGPVGGAAGAYAGRQIVDAPRSLWRSDPARSGPSRWGRLLWRPSRCPPQHGLCHFQPEGQLTWREAALRLW